MADRRELLAVREIAHALLAADHPGDVQQFALSRVTPLLGASFSLLMQLGADGELLRPVAQHEWPAAHRAWIGALRVRVGDGPSGLAVAERRLVEVEDLFADTALGGWHDVARELGFRSIIAAPLEIADEPIGAVAFYFADATNITDEQRALVRLVADQLAAATDKARRVDEFRRANAALADANAELEAQASAWEIARRQRRHVEEIVVKALLQLTAPDDARDPAQRLQAVRALARVAQEFTDVTEPGRGSRGDAHQSGYQDIDLPDALRTAVSAWRRLVPAIAIHVTEPTVLLPTLRMHAGTLQRALELLLGIGVLGAATGHGEVRAAVGPGPDHLSLTVAWDGRHILPEHDQPLPAPSRILLLCEDAFSWEAHDPYPALRQSVTAADLPLAQVLVAQLGGDLRFEDARDDPAGAQSITMVFPVLPDPA